MAIGTTLTVGPSGRDYTSLQDAIDAAEDGDTIYVYPGSYTETAEYNGKPVGLVIDKSVQIYGVDESGTKITDASATEATIIASEQHPSLTSFFVTADNVGIQGLKFEAAAPPEDVPGKAFVILGANNFGLFNSVVTGPEDVPGWWAGPIYFQDIGNDPDGFVSNIYEYTIEGNILTGAVMITNGVGYGRDPIYNEMIVRDNTFLDVARSDDVPGPWGIYSNGIHDGLSYYNIPSVMPTNVTGNKFPDGAARYLVETDQDPTEIGMDRDYVENFIDTSEEISNFAYGVDSEGDLVVSIVDWYEEDISYVSLEDLPSKVVVSSGDKIITSTGGKYIQDTISVDGITVEVLESGGLGASLDVTLDTGVASLYLAGAGRADVQGNGLNNAISGNEASNWITGGDGIDVLDGRGGDDFLEGGTGDDFLDGGEDVDTALYNAKLDVSALSLGFGETNKPAEPGWLVDAGEDGTDSLYSVEIVQFEGGRFLLVGHGGFETVEDAIAYATKPGDVVVSDSKSDGANQIIDESGEATSFYITTGSGNDTVTTGSGDDTIETGDGDDTAKGGDGNDNVDTGDGNDTIIGGSGNGDDVYNGGLMNDTVVYSSAGSPIVVDLRAIDRSTKSVSGADGAGGQPDTMGELLDAAGYAATTPIGRAEGADIGTDALLNIENVVAGARHDKVIGNAEANIIYGGAGNDNLRGNKGGDTIFGEIGKDKIKGGRGHDTLDGGSNKDTLIGGKGKDVLIGGGGHDKLKGMGGKDTFVFNDIGKADKVKDFKGGKDMLAFDNDVFTGLGDEGALKSKYFTIGTEAETRKQMVIYDDKSGKLWYDADGKGGDDAVKIATLKHAPDLSADDILVI